MTRSGGCLCGAVQFAVTGAPTNVMMRHGAHPTLFAVGDDAPQHAGRP